MNILALDLATRTGWALQENGNIESGVQTFDVKRGESPGMRYVRFNRWLDDMALRIALNSSAWLIVFEQAHHRGGAATEVAAGFSTRVLEFCSRHGVEHTTVHTGTLKKFATGSGSAKKPQMISELNKRFGLTVTDDNEADARWILEYAKKEIINVG